mgnify:FL=1
MARLVTKFKYLKPNRKQKAGGYAKYIATREGAEKIDESFRYSFVSGKQCKLIEKLLKDFPDTKEMHEYKDYLANPSAGNASEFISRAIEDNAHIAMGRKTYADYIATRPRAERFGSHGLFTDDGVEVKLDEVSEELNRHNGNVWTVILSLRREDAERLGFGEGARWRDMLRTETQELSKNFKIPMENLKWYAAFHNESHHPHVHMIIYSKLENEGYLTERGVQNLRSAFARDIFAQDLVSVYEEQTRQRDKLKSYSKEYLHRIVQDVGGKRCGIELQEKLLRLAERLSKTKGKKVYGYLKADVKALVRCVVDELEKDERIAELYALWYEQREQVIRTYTETLSERIPLSQNDEFKYIRNAVIQAAMQIVNGPNDEIELTLQRSKHSDNGIKQDKKKISNSEEKKTSYHAGKIFLHEGNVEEAMKCFEVAAENGNDFAEYQLGRIYVFGTGVERDKELALCYLRSSADKGNVYAAKLIEYADEKEAEKKTYAAIGALWLLHDMARMMVQRIEPGGRLDFAADKKLRKKIEEKKQAQGLKQD